MEYTEEVGCTTIAFPFSLSKDIKELLGFIVVLVVKK